MRLIYLDYNTTTPLAGAAREAMMPFLYEFYGSPSSSHWTGAAVAEAVEDARANVASMLQCDSHDIVFTSGGTESINLAMQMGWELLKAGHSHGHQVLLTTWEYEAIHRRAAHLLSCGCDVRVMCGGSPAGWSPSALAAAIGDRPTLLCVSLADGHTGIVQPVTTLVQLLEETGQRDHVVLVVDACQAPGKIEIAFDSLGADFLAISGHKMYSSKGVGALAIRAGLNPATTVFGEWAERGLRNGTPNVPGIIGMAAAAHLVTASIAKFTERCQDLFQIFDETMNQCRGKIFPFLTPTHRSLPNTRLFILNGCDIDLLLMRCPELCVKTFQSSEVDVLDDWSATLPQQHVADAPETHWVVPLIELDQRCFCALTSAGLSPQQRASALLLSVGWNTTETEMVKAAETICEAYDQVDSH